MKLVTSSLCWMSESMTSTLEREQISKYKWYIIQFIHNKCRPTMYVYTWSYVVMRTISGQHMLCACYIKNPLSDISTSCDRVVYLPYSGMIYVICVTEECNYVLGRQRARTRPAPRCLSAAFCALPRPQ